MKTAKFIISAVDKTKKVFLSIKNRIRGITESFTVARAAAAGFAGFLTGRLLGAVTGMADGWAKLSAQIKLVTANEGEAVAVREQLLEVAKRTRTEFAANVDLYTSLARSTRSLGLTQTELIGITETISQAMQVSGATAAESAASLRQLGQALASGVLRGDEFNSLMEQAPRLMQALADSLGVTIGQLREMASEGELTSEQLVTAFQGQAEKISKEFEVLPRTFSQVFTSIQNDLLAFVGKADEANAASARITAQMARGWEYLKSAVGRNKDAIADGIQAIGTALDIMARATRVAFNVVTAAIKTVIGLLGSLVWAYKKAMAAITFGEMSRNFAREADAMRDTINEIGASIAQDFRDMGDAINPVVDKTQEAQKATQDLGGSVDQVTESVNTLSQANENAALSAKKIKTAIKSAQDAVADTARDFAGLIDEMRAGPEISAENIGILDYAEQVNKAQRALADGRGEEAAKATGKAADYLRQMKEAGTESDIVLTGLAQRLATIGVEAEELKQAQIVTTPKVEIDEAQAKAAFARLQALADKATVKIKVQTESVAGWGNQTDIEQQIGEAARQQGGL